MSKGLRAIQRFIDRPWYAPFLGFLCAADLVVLVVPLDPLLLSSCLLRPKSWWRVFLSMTVGAILGAFVVAYLVELDPTLVDKHFHTLLASPSWLATQENLRQHGDWALLLFGLSPLPQVFPVLVSALAGIPAMEIALGLGVGRVVKYAAYSSLAAHAPHLLRRVPGLRKTMDQLGEP